MSDKIRRLKETLESVTKSSSKVFIVGHDEPDYDAIGSAIGISIFSKELNENTYIVVNDTDIELEPGVKKIIDDNKIDHNIIGLSRFRELVDNQSSLITTDVNKKNIISVKDYLDVFNDIVIIDHHQETEDTIKTDKKFIDEKISSASEIVSDLLNKSKIKYKKDIANYLLAGIILDTKRYMKNTSPKTHDIAEKLMRRGADSDYVNDLFLTEFEDEGQIALLIHSNSNTNFQLYSYNLFKEYNVSFTLNRENPTEIYKKVNIAKAADKMLKFRIDAAFVLGYTNDSTISISARSKSDIDVGEVMKYINGGGNAKNAASKIEVEDNCDREKYILEVEKEIMRNLEYGIYIKDQQEEAKVYTKKVK